MAEEETLTLSPSSTLATLREAVKQVEREDYLDGQAAITAAVSELAEEHGIQDMPATENNTPQEENVDANLPKLSKPHRRASVNEDARMLIQQMGGVTFEPKPSESIAIEKDIHDLVDDMNKTKPPESAPKSDAQKSKPMNPRYLRALGLQKREQQSMNKSRTSLNRISTTLSDISKVLIESEDSRWCEQFSQTTFKSYNEEMLFRNMQKVIPPKISSSSSKKVVSPHEINRQTMKQKQREFQESWSQLGRHSSGGRAGGKDGYMRYDDMENCTFQPKTNETKASSSSNNNSNNPDDEMIQSGSKFENFIARQEAKERSRRQDNEFTKGKGDYEKYELDKKYCPRCNGKQSYDEVKEKRKNCPNCHVAYRPRTCWGDIEEGFYSRQNKHWLRCQENEMKRKMEEEENLKRVEMMKMDRKTGEIRHVVRGERGGGGGDDKGALKWTKELEKDFFGRHEEYQESVQKKLLRVEREMYGKNLDSEDEEDEEYSREDEDYSGGGDSRASRGYYYQPQRSVGSTWSGRYGEKKEALGRSMSAGRQHHGWTTRGSRTSLGAGGGATWTRTGGGGGGYHHGHHASTQRRARDENEYLFRYRR
jgi:hypothetical protein